MQKIAIVTKSALADWQSCRSITANLIESYRRILGVEIRVFEIEESNTIYDLYSVASDLSKWAPGHVIFVDYKPCPALVLKALNEAFADRVLPRIIIHVFGDFVLESPVWISHEEVLKRFKITWVCASSRQAKLVSQFLQNENSTVNHLPFPVNMEQFHYSEGRRELERSNLSLEASEFVIFYSGRLSLQKNVIQLVQIFTSLAKVFPQPLVLLLAGPIDDLGNPYFGRHHPEGLMSYRLQTLFSEANRSSTSEVRYLGDLNSQELAPVYNAADLFVSLSTHNDEDYGMSPAEALMSGCFCLLSDWGGYSDFNQILPQQTALAPINFNSDSRIDLNNATKALFGAILLAQQSNMKLNSDRAAQVLSCSNISQRLEKIIGQKELRNFQGWNSLFREVKYTLAIKGAAPFAVGQNPSELYKRVYSVYAN